jgi:hypothetical protein
MKIKSIDSSRTDDTQTAFKTEPPLTEEVIQCAIKEFFGSEWFGTYFEEGGSFIVRRTGIPREQISVYERRLTDAENLVQKRKRKEQTNRDDYLKGLSASVDLPLE